LVVNFRMVMGHLWHGTDRGKTKYSWKDLSHYNWVHHKSYINCYSLMHQ